MPAVQHCAVKRLSALVRRSSGKAVSRAEEGRIDGKDSVETMLALGDSSVVRVTVSRTKPALARWWCGCRIRSRSAG